MVVTSMARPHTLTAILPCNDLDPEQMPWGMYEFSIPDPDETSVSVGWPTRLRG